MIDSVGTRIRTTLSRALPRVGTFLLAAAVLVSLSACGDDDDGGSGMEGPLVNQSIDSRTLTADQEPVEVNLGSVFSGQNLSYTAMSSNSDIASASVSGTTLSVTPQNGGNTTVTVGAQNDAGETDTSFDVTVNLPEAPGPPSE